MFVAQFMLILILFIVTPTHALFFHNPKNAILDFLASFRDKKEMKKELPDIHHYHLHYYPVLVHSHSIHPTEKPVKAPDKNELETLHTNKLESLGWSNQEYKHIPDPSIHYGSSLENWSNSISYRPTSIWDESIDRREESKPNPGILVQVPLNQQIILQQPEKEEDDVDSNPLLSFFQRLQRIKNTIFSSSRKSDDDKKSETNSNKMKGVVMFAHPNALAGGFFRKI